MRKLLFWGSLPFLIPQALYVRRTAPRYAAAATPWSGETGTGRTMRLLGVGDSIIAGVGASTMETALVGRTALNLARILHCRIAWSAIGRSGANSNHIIDEQLPMLPEEPVDVFLLSLGVNDVTSLTRTRRWEANLRLLFEGLHAHSADARIVFVGLPPLGGFPLLPQPLRAVLGTRARTLDASAEAVCAEYDHVLYVPVRFDPRPEKFAADGYHPSEQSYGILGAEVAAAIAGDVADDRPGLQE